MGRAAALAPGPRGRPVLHRDCGARVRRRGAGVLLAATGCTWFLGNFSADLLYLYRGPLVHLLVAYAGVRPRTRVDGFAVAVGYAAAVAAPVWGSDPVSVVLAIALVAVAARGFATATGPARRERLAALQVAVAFARGARAGCARARAVRVPGRALRRRGVALRATAPAGRDGGRPRGRARRDPLGHAARPAGPRARRPEARGRLLVAGRERLPGRRGPPARASGPGVGAIGDARGARGEAVRRARARCRGARRPGARRGGGVSRSPGGVKRRTAGRAAGASSRVGGFAAAAAAWLRTASGARSRGGCAGTGAAARGRGRHPRRPARAADEHLTRARGVSSPSRSTTCTSSRAGCTRASWSRAAFPVR